MKKLWNQYSYAIILVILSCSVALILSFQQSSEVKDQYLKVSVSEGDSLWEISNQYSDQHSLSNKEFISWVKKHNKNIDEKIYPGDEIMIPVSTETPDTTEFASAYGE